LITSQIIVFIILAYHILQVWIQARYVQYPCTFGIGGNDPKYLEVRQTADLFGNGFHPFELEAENQA
jgi:hypothetical protein